jgi:hypothetical protein
MHATNQRTEEAEGSTASPDSAALHEEGYEGALVARANSSRDHLSMSIYGKSQPP